MINCIHCGHAHPTEDAVTLCGKFKEGYTLPESMTGNEPTEELLKALIPPKSAVAALDKSNKNSKGVSRRMEYDEESDALVEVTDEMQRHCNIVEGFLDKSETLQAICLLVFSEKKLFLARGYNSMNEYGENRYGKSIRHMKYQIAYAKETMPFITGFDGNIDNIGQAVIPEPLKSIQGKDILALMQDSKEQREKIFNEEVLSDEYKFDKAFDDWKKERTALKKIIAVEKSKSKKIESENKSLVDDIAKEKEKNRELSLIELTLREGANTVSQKRLLMNEARTEISKALAHIRKVNISDADPQELVSEFADLILSIRKIYSNSLMLEPWLEAEIDMLMDPPNLHRNGNTVLVAETETEPEENEQ